MTSSDLDRFDPGLQQQVAYAAPARGWVLVGRTTRGRRPVLDLVVSQLRRSSWTPLVLPLDVSDVDGMVDRLRLAVAQVRGASPDGRPVAFLGSGRAAAAGCRGDDLLIGGPGRDRTIGGPGRDTVIPDPPA